MYSIKFVPMEYTALGEDGTDPSSDPTGANISDSRRLCMSCTKGEHGYPVPGWRDDGGRDSYYWACAVCKSGNTCTCTPACSLGAWKHVCLCNSGLSLHWAAQPGLKTGITLAC